MLRININKIILFSFTLLIFNCSKDKSDSTSIDELREHCLIAWESPDDAYLRIINTLDVNIYIEYVDLPYAAHMWANSCELMGVFADTYSAIRIRRCESGNADPDGGPADCGSSGPTIQHSYYLQSSQTEEIIIGADFFTTGNLPNINIPVADFSASQLTISAGKTIRFTDLSTKNPTRWSWDFGDGGTSSSRSPAYTYTNAGTYTVSLTATNSDGSDTERKSNYITVTEVSSVSEIIFNPSLTYGLLTDVDGNTYKTIHIGEQEWMAENLKTTKYKDGTTIPLVTFDTAWGALTTPAYCWYNNDVATYKSTYGALYNWYTVNTAMLCPTGWHTPTNTEWTTLINFLGGESVAGGKLKETGTTHWKSPNTGATNETGFSAIPGGHRSRGAFFWIGESGYWWGATEFNDDLAWFCPMNFKYGHAYRDFISKRNGLSVRCVKD